MAMVNCSSGVRGCADLLPGPPLQHRVETNADGWADDIRLSDIEPNFTCIRCGKRGAEIRPKFSQAKISAIEGP